MVLDLKMGRGKATMASSNRWDINKAGVVMDLQGSRDKTNLSEAECIYLRKSVCRKGKQITHLKPNNQVHFFNQDQCKWTSQIREMFVAVQNLQWKEFIANPSIRTEDLIIKDLEDQGNQPELIKTKNQRTKMPNMNNSIKCLQIIMQKQVVTPISTKKWSKNNWIKKCWNSDKINKKKKRKRLQLLQIQSKRPRRQNEKCFQINQTQKDVSLSNLITPISLPLKIDNSKF